MTERKGHIVCIASEFKGNEFLEECQNAGWFVTLVTRKHLLDSPWAWTSLNDVKTVERSATTDDYMRAIANIAGSKVIDRIVGLDEFDIITAARAREHLQVEGLSASYSLRFRDKLHMRNLAFKIGMPCPEFTGIFNKAQIDDFLDRTKPPWIVKPRTEGAAFGIRKCETKEHVWQVLMNLDSRNTWRDHPSQYLLEKFIEGEVYHVDSVVCNGEIVAVAIGKYGAPPYKISHHGGVFITSTLDYDSQARTQLLQLNEKLLKGFEYQRGVAHAEFLQSAETSEFYFLEVACRVGGAYIANMHEYANGFNLWREWAKLETATEQEPYRPPKLRNSYAGICLALAREEFPDTSNYNDPEIVYRIDKPKHVGFIFETQNKQRLQQLLNSYAERITKEYLMVLPAKEHHDE
jgi:biotin carboxylase